MNMRKYVEYFSCCFLVVFLISCGTGRVLFNEFGELTKSNEAPLVIFIGNGNPASNQSFKQLEAVGDYAKIPLKYQKISHLKTIGELPETAKVVCLDESYALNQQSLDSLLSFVAKGGHLVLTNISYDPRMSYLMGLDLGANFRDLVKGTGYYFDVELIPGLKHASIEQGDHKGMPLSSFETRGVEILATSSSNRSYPLILAVKRGNGRVILHNTEASFSKDTRGLLFSLVLQGLESIPYPVANVASIHLDDFPAPLYDIYKEPVKTNMNLTFKQYVDQIWWPDMKKLADEHNIVYTAFPAFDYRNRTNPPFSFKEWQLNKSRVAGAEMDLSSLLVRDVTKNGHEIGLHGYNHVSLTKENWKNNNYIVPAFEAVKKKWATDGFGALPTAYVPPSNIIDSVGLFHLNKAMPELKYMMSTYLGDFEEGGDREFGPDPWNNGFFDFPRISSGYDLDENVIFDIYSTFLYTGIWTHFVHPDDVFQIPDESNLAVKGGYDFRNSRGLPWHSSKGKIGLLDKLNMSLTDFKKLFPFTRFLGGTQASELTVDWRYSVYQRLNSDEANFLFSENTSKKTRYCWFVFIKGENVNFFEKKLNSDFLAIFKTPLSKGFLYQLITADELIEVPGISFLEDKFIVANVLGDQRDYFETKLKMLPLMERVEEHIHKNELEKASSAIEEYMIRNGKFSGRLFNRYTELMLWQDKQTRFWEFMESLYRKNPSDSFVSALRKYGMQNGWTDESMHEKWLWRAISNNMGGVGAMYEYLENFQSNAHIDKTKFILNLVAQSTNQKEDWAKYLSFLLDCDDQGLFGILKKFKPCEAGLQNLSARLAQFYADNLQYDNALLWAECSNSIDKNTRDYWLVRTEGFLNIKQEDPSTYFTLLMSNNVERSLEELEKEPTCNNALSEIADQIAVFFGDHSNYKKALAWAKCANSIPIKKMLTYLYENEKTSDLIKHYDHHISKHPYDGPTKHHMAKIFIYLGKLEQAANILGEIKDKKKFKELRTQLNEHLSFLEMVDQGNLIKSYPFYFPEGTKKKITEKLRKQKGNDLISEGQSVNDRFDPTLLKFFFGYQLQDKKRNLHAISATNGIVFPIRFVEEENENQQRNLYGISYKFETSENKKINLKTELAVESNGDQFFYHLGVGVGFSKESDYYSLNTLHRPVQNAPGYIRQLYHTLLEGYAQGTIFPKFKHFTTFEGSYFSDANFMAVLQTRFEYNLKVSKSLAFSPLAEISYGVASDDNRDGFPYWSADNRFYVGGGISLTLGNEKDGFFFRTSASSFYENQGEPSFERYSGNFHFSVLDYLRFIGSYEFYTLENFFSNAFSLGIRYHFK